MGGGGRRRLEVGEGLRGENKMEWDSVGDGEMDAESVPCGREV